MFYKTSKQNFDQLRSQLGNWDLTRLCIQAASVDELKGLLNLELEGKCRMRVVQGLHTRLWKRLKEDEWNAIHKAYKQKIDQWSDF